MEWIVDLLPDPWSAIVFVVLVGSAVVVVKASGRGADIVRVATDRFVYGIPWGTLAVMVLLVTTYVLLQDGWAAWSRPVTYPFTAWSYYYPLGQVTAGFAHANPGHLLANLLGTAVFGTIAEYAWGHYPTDRSHWPRRPWIRAGLYLPAAVLVALATTTFAWGPVIGFSGAVFAFAGFAVVRYPILTVLAQVVQNVVVVVIRALFAPVVVHEVGPTVNPPGWAGIAVQGHTFGFLLGVLAGLWLLYRREPPDGPDLARVWFGVTVIGLSTSLWAVWTARGGDVFVLFRGAGVAGLLVGALVVAVASQAPDEPLVAGVAPRHVAVCLIALPVIAMSVAAVPMGLTTIAPNPPPDEAVAIEDYTVYYDTNREVTWQPGINSSALPSTASTATRSGLFVVSEKRQMQLRPASTEDLARKGQTTVTVGGIGWRQHVDVNRTGWTPVGNDSVYRIVAAHDGDRTVLFTAPDRQADATVAGHRIAVTANETGFGVRVTAAGNRLGHAPMPAPGENVSVGSVQLHRDRGTLVAEHGETRVVVAGRD